MKIFKMIRPKKDQIDPLYYQVHKLHFEEEVRHSSFALMMLKLPRAKNASLVERFLQKFDFFLSDIIEKVWTIIELKKINQVVLLKDRHPTLKHFNSIIQKINKLSFHKKLKILMNDSEYLSMMINADKHDIVKNEIKESRSLSFNLFRKVT